jgi:phosphatidylglycerophosphate synthase
VIAVVVSVASGLQILILALAAVDPQWLSPLKGRIGLANWISAVRFGIALIIPYIYISQPAGDVSNYLATTLIILTFVSDVWDGTVARRWKEVTRVGKALDPLSDKIVQYPAIVGLFVATNFTMMIPETLSIPSLLVVSVTVLSLVPRDVGVIVWWFCTKIEIGAGLVDKLRAVVLAVWIIAVAVALCIPIDSLRIPIEWIAFAALAVGVTLSPISIVVDIIRVKKRHCTKN